MGLLRSLGCEDLRREGSVAKALMKRHSLEEIETAVRGLHTLFPKGPITLRMCYGKSRMGSYCGFRGAYEAGIKAQSRVPPAERRRPVSGSGPVAEYTQPVLARLRPKSGVQWEPAFDSRTGLESVGAILGRMR